MVLEPTSVKNHFFNPFCNGSLANRLSDEFSPGYFSLGICQKRLYFFLNTSCSRDRFTGRVVYHLRIYML